MMPNANWLFGLFGNRRVIGCKESDNALYMGMAHPVEPWRLLTDKRMDVILYQPQSLIQEQGTVDALATWGRPMDAYTLVPNPVYIYPEMTHLSDGTNDPHHMNIGDITRQMASEVAHDVQTLFTKRR